MDDKYYLHIFRAPLPQIHSFISESQSGSSFVVYILATFFLIMQSLFYIQVPSLPEFLAAPSRLKNCL
uniref:Putative ovule protein n=1 Tax=Solanum chacoense TaxID=4108 RepID=A0A0V0HD28_SOLCH